MARSKSKPSLPAKSAAKNGAAKPSGAKGESGKRAVPKSTKVAAPKPRPATKTVAKSNAPRTPVKSKRPPSRSTAQTNVAAEPSTEVTLEGYFLCYTPAGVEIARRSAATSNVAECFASYEEAKDRAIDMLICEIENLESALWSLKQSNGASG